MTKPRLLIISSALLIGVSGCRKEHIVLDDDGYRHPYVKVGSIVYFDIAGHTGVTNYQISFPNGSPCEPTTLQGTRQNPPHCRVTKTGVFTYNMDQLNDHKIAFQGIPCKPLCNLEVGTEDSPTQ